MSVPVPDGTRLPLTAAQLGIWFAQARDPHSPVYNTGEYVELTGPLDADRFERALRDVIARTDALRLRFHPEADGTVTQSADADPSFTVHRIDVSASPDPAAAADAWMRDVIARPLDAAGGGPLFTQALFKLGRGPTAGSATSTTSSSTATGSASSPNASPAPTPVPPPNPTAPHAS